MNLLLAQLQKDFRTFRLPLLVWGGWIAWKLAIAFGLTPGTSIQIPHALEAVTLTLLAVWAIQEDSLVDASSFWRTRPIPRLHLLAAKLAFLALPVGITYGVHLATARSGIVPGVSSAACIFAAGLIAFAAATSAEWKPFAYGVVFMCGAGFLASAAKHRPIHLGSLEMGGWPVLSILLVAGFAAITLHQYLTLRTKVSLGLLFALIFAAALLL